MKDGRFPMGPAAVLMSGLALLPAEPVQAAPARPTSALRILMIVTSHDRLGDSGKKTGIWLDELTTPYQQFVQAGAQVDIASPSGGAIPIDPVSQQKGNDSVTWFLEKAEGKARLAGSRALSTIKDDYDAYFVVGGHGVMWDLAGSAEVARLLSQAYQRGRVISAVCHGPAALVNVKLANGQPLLAGRKLTGFSNSEERAVNLDKVVPFALQTRLEALGGRYQAAEDFQPFVIQDGRLITGQNPASAVEVARLVMREVTEARKQRLAGGR